MRAIAARTSAGGSPRSVRVKTIASARRMASSGSRRRPRGGVLPPPNGSRESKRSRLTSRPTARCWNPSSRRKRSAPRSAARRAASTRFSPTTTSTPEVAFASATGSSPPCSAVDERALAGRHHDDAARGAAVSAREDRRAPALEAQPPGEKLHERRLARAAEGQVPDGDRRARQRVRDDPAGGVPRRAQLQGLAVEQGQGRQVHGADPRPAASAGASAATRPGRRGRGAAALGDEPGRLGAATRGLVGVLEGTGDRARQLFRRRDAAQDAERLAPGRGLPEVAPCPARRGPGLPPPTPRWGSARPSRRGCRPRTRASPRDTRTRARRWSREGRRRRGRRGPRVAGRGRPAPQAQAAGLARRATSSKRSGRRGARTSSGALRQPCPCVEQERLLAFAGRAGDEDRAAGRGGAQALGVGKGRRRGQVVLQVAAARGPARRARRAPRRGGRRPATAWTGAPGASERLREEAAHPAVAGERALRDRAR